MATERRRIGLREIRALESGRIAWDSAIPGFGARRQRAAVTYILKFRTAEGRQRWHTIGRHGAPWTPESARAEALRLLGEIVTGVDPAARKKAAREAITVRVLCERYLADAESGKILVRGGKPKKPLTLATDRGRIEGFSHRSPHPEIFSGYLPTIPVAMSRNRYSSVDLCQRWIRHHCRILVHNLSNVSWWYYDTQTSSKPVRVGFNGFCCFPSAHCTRPIVCISKQNKNWNESPNQPIRSYFFFISRPNPSRTGDQAARRPNCRLQPFMYSHGLPCLL